MNGRFVAFDTVLNGEPRVIDLRDGDDHGPVAVVGLGYVGLPTATAIAARGRHVIGIDVDPARLARIRALDVDLLPEDRDRLDFTLRHREFELSDDPGAVSRASAVVICVPTPIDGHHVPDLTALRAACSRTVASAQPGQLFVLVSTTYVGTTRELLAGPLEERGLRVGRDVFVAFSPERIDPGQADHAQESVPRVVGGVTEACTARATRLLTWVSAYVHPVSSPEAAELTKLHENVFRAVNIALANELSDACRVLGLDVSEVIEAASTKPYGFMPFWPGPGAGGHCIPCDPHYLLWQLRPLGRGLPVIEQAMASLAARPHQVVELVAQALSREGRGLTGSRVLLVGVSYKAGTRDVRETPALAILESLAERGADVAFHDPLVPELRVGDGLVLHSVEPFVGDDPYDLVLVHTAHPGADLAWLDSQPLVLDLTYRLHAGRRPAPTG